jgi:hypothetical protein
VNWSGLGQQFAFIKNRVKKYGWTKIYLFFTISNAKNAFQTIKNVNENNTNIISRLVSRKK